VKRKYKISRSELKAGDFARAKENVKLSGIAPKTRDVAKIAEVLKKVAV